MSLLEYNTMDAFKDISREQLLDLMEIKDIEIARLKQDNDILAEILRQMYKKYPPEIPGVEEGLNESCCADRIPFLVDQCRCK